MAHGREADAYDYLATSKVSELTVAQLEQALENSFLNKSNIEFWKGPITMHRLLEVSRTYPWGLPIPEAGNIFFEEVGALAVITIQPPGSEIWQIEALRGFGDGGSCTTTIAFEDGTSALQFRVGDTIAQSGTNYDLDGRGLGSVQITNSLYLTVTETGGAQGLRIQAAYQVVSL